MNILVTGSEENIGKKLVPYLREKGHRFEKRFEKMLSIIKEML